jgi:hypothetical protein
MKKAEPVVYLRISTSDQAKSDKGKKALEMSTIKRQLARVKAGLKALGMRQPKKANIFAEVASGRNPKRPVWIEARGASMNGAGNGRTIFVVAEPSRFGREIDLMVEAWAPMMRAGVPILETGRGVFTGTSQDPRPFEKYMFLQLALQGSLESDIKSLKGKESAGVSRQQGIKPASAASLFPFARIDPLDAYLENVGLLALKVGEGGGPSNFKRTVSATTQPNGPMFGAVEQMRKREAVRREKLSSEEYQVWRDYRTKIRNLMIELDHDPSRDAPRVGSDDNRWGARAVWRYASGYLAEPFKSNYRQVTDEEIDDYLSDPFPYLSDKDKGRYRSIVGKRARAR